MSQRQIEITGEPVTMTDKDGNQVRGKRVLYYVDDGRAVVQGQGGGGRIRPPPSRPGRRLQGGQPMSAGEQKPGQAKSMLARKGSPECRSRGNRGRR